MTNKILQGDTLAVLKTLLDCSVQACVTSPPYFGLRDYGVPGQIGLEESPEAYTEKLVQVFREVRRVLKDDGVLWLNLGDSYAATSTRQTGRNDEGPEDLARRAMLYSTGQPKASTQQNKHTKIQTQLNIRPKNLLGIPWRVAFALQADGWILRSDIIWHKTNAMPESVKDRPTKAHEYLFLLAKNERYYYDADSIREEAQLSKEDKIIRPYKGQNINNAYARGASGYGHNPLGRNCRSVWSIATVPYKGAHFAVMPQKLIEPCVLASSRPDDIILDPFAGAGTVPLVALKHGRRYIGIELNPEYIKLAEERLTGVQLIIPEGREDIA